MCIGGAPGVNQLSVNGITQSSGYKVGSNGYLFANDNTSSILGNAAKYIAFTTSNTEAMRIVSTGYVGIGTSTPTKALDIVGAAAATGVMSTGTYFSGPSLYGSSAASGVLTLAGTNNATPGNVRINPSGGNVGIGVSAPSTALEVSGTVSATGVRVTGDIYYSGTLNDTSDHRLKTAIRPLPYNDVLERVMLLKPVQYQRKAVPGRIEWGFIAQDVEQLFPQLVTTADDPSGTMSISYLGLLPPVVQAIQELKADNDSLRAQVGNLKAANDNLKARLDTEQQKLDAQQQKLESQQRRFDAQQRSLEAQQRDIDALKKSAGLH